MTGPGFTNVDVSLFKTTRITERWGLQFRAEFFNLLNHSNFGIPSTVMLSQSGAVNPAAGLISRENGTSRQIQFGMKLTF